MKILCIYNLREKNARNTIDEHLYSFRRYSDEDVYYLNVAFGIPWYIEKIYFDVVIYHYTFFALKWDPKQFERLRKKCGRLKYISGYKIAMPQDEYIYSIIINLFFRDFGIKTVYTCLPPSDYQKVYDKEISGLDYYFSVPAGFIDETAVNRYANESPPLSERPIDIGYRARKVPYWLGKHGNIKWLLGEKFNNAAKHHNLKTDISSDPEGFFMGKDWYRFLQSCKVFIGCEGGASLHDPTGEIRQKVEEYVQLNPNVSFEEVESVCFPGLDGNLNLFAISPRHYECCITKTCQTLVEGEYGGIFKPGIHYIEIKKDWSNVDQVVNKINDIKYCQEIADNAYRDIVQSGLYTYRGFVERVLSHVKEVSDITHSETDNDNVYLRLLELREKINPVGLFFLSIYYATRSVAVKLKRFITNYNFLNRK